MDNIEEQSIDNITITLSKKDAENLLIALKSAHEFLAGLYEYSMSRSIDGIKPIMATVWDVINQLVESDIG